MMGAFVWVSGWVLVVYRSMGVSVIMLTSCILRRTRWHAECQQSPFRWSVCQVV